MKLCPSQTALKTRQHELENFRSLFLGVKLEFDGMEATLTPGSLILPSCEEDESGSSLPFSTSLFDLLHAAPESHHHVVQLVPEQDSRSS